LFLNNSGIFIWKSLNIEDLNFLLDLFFLFFLFWQQLFEKSKYVVIAFSFFAFFFFPHLLLLLLFIGSLQFLLPFLLDFFLLFINSHSIN